MFQGEARLLNCKTVMGEITVLDNHETLITALSAGNIKVVPAKASDNEHEARFFPIKSGFLEVRPGNEVRCIVED